MSKKISKNMKKFIENYIEKDYYIMYELESSDLFIISNKDVAKLGISNELNSDNTVMIGDAEYRIMNDINVKNTVGLIEVEGEEIEDPQTPVYKNKYLKYADYPALLVTRPLKNGRGKIKPNKGDLYCGYYRKNVFSDDVTYTLEFYTDETIKSDTYIILDPKNYPTIQDVGDNYFEHGCKDLNNIRVNTSSSTKVVKKILV